ncbi:MAG: hypothetical protein FJ297_02775 [Planctomycetes bacterium]|nr:hypothetical protein [Planctomycetota bacterium]
MEFHRSGERRRRVLLDESRLDTKTPVPTPSSGEPASPRWGPAGSLGYSRSAQRDRQPPVLDLIPVRAYTLFVLFLAMAAVWTGLEAAYGQTRVVRFCEDPALRNATDLERADSVGGWYASMVWMAMSGMSLGIYVMRRYRLDDLRGRYRVWLWAAVFACGASADSVARLSEAGPGVLEWASGGPSARVVSRSLAPVLPSIVLVSLAALRLGLEMRRCRSATAWLIGAWIGAACVWIESAGARFPPGPMRGMVVPGIHLAALSAALFSLLVYGRFVYREAHGLIRVSARRPRRSSRLKSQADSPRKGRSKADRASADPAKPSPASAKPAAATIAASSPSSSGIGATIRADDGRPGGAEARRSVRASTGSATHAPQSSAAATNAPRPSAPDRSTPPAPANPSASKPSVLERGGRDAKPVGEIEVDEESGGPLSRSERKRLKKEQRRQQRAAA